MRGAAQNVFDFLKDSHISFCLRKRAAERETAPNTAPAERPWHG